MTTAEALKSPATDRASNTSVKTTENLGRLKPPSVVTQSREVDTGQIMMGLGSLFLEFGATAVGATGSALQWLHNKNALNNFPREEFDQSLAWFGFGTKQVTNQQALQLSQEWDRARHGLEKKVEQYAQSNRVRPKEAHKSVTIQEITRLARNLRIPLTRINEEDSSARKCLLTSQSTANGGPGVVNIVTNAHAQATGDTALYGVATVAIVITQSFSSVESLPPTGGSGSGQANLVANNSFQVIVSGPATSKITASCVWRDRALTDSAVHSTGLHVDTHQQTKFGTYPIRGIGNMPKVP